MADKTIPQLDAATTPLNPNDIIALVQGGSARHTGLTALAGFVLGNITVVENSNGTSIRIPGPNLQICWGTVTVEYFDARSLRATWTYPQAFASTPYVPAPPLASSGGGGLNLNNIGQPNVVVGPTASSATIYLWENSQPYVAGRVMALRVVAFGTY